MREFTEPEIVGYPTIGNLTDDVERRAGADPGELMLRRRLGQDWVDVSAGAFRREVMAVAKGIIAAGVGAGDRVGVMSSTRYEWTLVDYAIWYAGAVSVPIYETSSAEQVQWILSDSEAVAVFLEGVKHSDVFAEVAGLLPAVWSVWVFEEGAVDALVEAGAQVPDSAVLARREAVGPDAAATI
ncbi:MAG: long-chain acyl-CoA synthetase, partial [Actinomycetota bacterium]|nr:long-chain acyl-CoA synthetase [Actinomycetota bacterium]